MEQKLIETVIVKAVEQVPELSGKVFPLNAPEKECTPFCVYVTRAATEADSLGGWLGNYDAEIELNILHQTYKEMKKLSSDVVEQLKNVEEATITISEDAPEIFEQDIQAYRKIISINLMY